MMSDEPVVFDVYRGTSHDGPGLRTTLFFQGCPLHCAWCHNPESISLQPKIWWDKNKCIGCLRCVNACPTHSLQATDHGIQINRSTCLNCGTCTVVCPAKAQNYTGKKWPMDLLVKEALKDRPYYTAFGGGVTVSGGEPLLQYRCVAELFRQLKTYNVHTAVDTCGNVPWTSFQSVLPYTNCFLYDIKLLDSDMHQKFTGVPNHRILENLLLLAEFIRNNNHNIELWIRTPLIPNATATDKNILEISLFIQQNLLDLIGRWELCAFNNVCKTKYEKMQQVWAFADEPLLSQETVDRIKQVISNSGFPEDKLVISGIIATPQ